MDLKGSIKDAKLKIIPSVQLKKYLESLANKKDAPDCLKNLAINKKHNIEFSEEDINNKPDLHITSDDLSLLESIEKYVNLRKVTNDHSTDTVKKSEATINETTSESFDNDEKSYKPEQQVDDNVESGQETEEQLYLNVQEIDSLYIYLCKKRISGENVPYLHELLEGADIKLPENEIIKRNPVLEARCVKLRAQQEAREYRNMTRSVDNVRMRLPEDSISYQLKQVNRQLIAIGQFIISIFAGFLFGFKGVDWIMGGILDFGFRLLLGVICALVIALAEIYFLAKKLNEEMAITQTVQLGGPPKFSEEVQNEINLYKKRMDPLEKEHND